MATYYVRTDGNNANVGTGSASNQAWQTITYALANMSLTNGTNYLYIAPGVYRESPTVTVTPSSTQTLEIVGDTTASIFIGVTAGNVRITNFANDNTNPSASTVFTCAKTYVALRNLCFVMYGTASFTNSQYITIDKCLFESTQYSNNTTVKMTANGTTPINATITKSIFIGSYCLNICGPTAGSTFNFSVAISDCLFIGQRTLFIDSSTSQFSNTGGNGLTVYNSTFICDQGFGLFTTNATNQSVIRNCNFIGNGVSNSFGIVSQGTDRQTEDYNRFSVTTARSNCSTGASSITGLTGIDWSTSLLNSQIPVAIFAPFASSPLTGSGTSTGAPSTDIYSNNWTTGTDVGAFARTSLASTSFYFPSERNASTITIAPGSTSQSIELYLGATGLTFSTSGLQAYYIRNRSAPVAITLVTQTATGAWTSGGFAEISSSLTPGVYRLDVPNAAFASGADDVTVVVRGASGTNGAVMTVKLSSGGLTSAQTASAVWGADVAGYVAETNFGGVVNATRNVSGNTEIIAQDIPSNVWEEVRANHTTAGTFGEYVNTSINTGAIADAVWDEAQSGHTTAGTFGSYLDSKVSDAGAASRIQLRQGPFLIKQNAVDSVITEVNQFLSTVPNIEMVLIDSSGGSVSVAGATLLMRVRNQAGTAVVNNVTPSVAYADGGVIRWSPNLSWTALGVTTAGTYRIVVERTMSGVTTTFGPFLVQLSSG